MTGTRALRRIHFPGTLAGRIMAGSVLMAAIAAFALVALAISILALRASVAREAHSKDTLVAALTLEQAAFSVEGSLRGYLLTTNPRFLDSLDESRREIEPDRRALETLVVQDPEQRRRVQTIVAQIDAYLSEYARPLIQIARIAPRVARSTVAVNEGKRRTDAIRAGFDQLVRAEDIRAAERRRSVRADSVRALMVTVLALVLSVVVIVALGLFISRRVGRSISRAASAATEIASGDLTVRLDERGVEEVAQLGRAFNAMARSLDDGRRELLDQNARLEESERQKSELITIVSHELRTPLTSLLGFTSLLRTRDVGADDRARYLQIVHDEGRRLAALVDTFLDLRKIEAGRGLELRLEEVELTSLVRDQAEFLLSHAPRHRLVLRLPSHDVIVRADRDRMAQVISNLIGNAVKYSPDGGAVEVTVKDGQRVRIEVKDSGLGIAPDDQPRVFTKFFRGAAADAGIPGTGLGLAVVREIVEAHNGRIGFVSSPWRGSIFWVELDPSGEDLSASGSPTAPGLSAPRRIA